MSTEKSHKLKKNVLTPSTSSPGCFCVVNPIIGSYHLVVSEDLMNCIEQSAFSCLNRAC